MPRVTGHVKLAKRKRGDVYYLKYRTPSGKQIERKLGPAWTERSRPPAGFYTRKMAEDALSDLLAGLRRGEVPDPGDRQGKTFEDAVAEWVRFSRDDRDLQDSTLRDYRNEGGKLLQEFGAEKPIEQIDADAVEDWRQRELGGKLSRRTLQKRLVLLGGIMRRAKRIGWVAVDPTADVDPITVKTSGEFNVLTPDQVEAVARAADGDLFKVAIIVAAYTGLRTGEVRALRWRDIDFANSAIRVTRNMPAGGIEGPPKGGKVRSVPMIDDAAVALDGLSRRDLLTADDDRVFPGPGAGGMLGEDALRDALYAAMEKAKIDRKSFPAKGGFTFHDLRHTFGTLAVQVFALTDVKAYMGHADISTTMRYVHHVPQTDAAQKFTEAIRRAKGGVPKPSPQISPEQPKTKSNNEQDYA